MKFDLHIYSRPYDEYDHLAEQEISSTPPYRASGPTDFKLYLEGALKRCYKEDNAFVAAGFSEVQFAHSLDPDKLFGEPHAVFKSILKAPYTEETVTVHAFPTYNAFQPDEDQGDKTMSRRSLTTEIQTTRQEQQQTEGPEDVVRVYAKNARDVLRLQHLEEKGLGEIVEKGDKVCLEIRPDQT